MLNTKITTCIILSLSLIHGLPRSHSTLQARGVTLTSSNILPMHSPAFLPKFPPLNLKPVQPPPTGPIQRISRLRRQDYPENWVSPDIQHPEVQAAIKSIDWEHVPKLKPQTSGDSNYDTDQDKACWWTRSQCTTPKVNYLPEDVSACPRRGDFALTYDDGPLSPQQPNDPWAEPRLYDFLARHHQRATLFYIGSNVVTFPDAAIRAYQSGHTLCAHTWSHPKMTSLTNEAIVAELYWSVRAIKEATGVTPRCWRPPYGDVDDRVRAIAHQFGFYTLLWNSDSFDWGLPSSANGFRGVYTQDQVDSYFQAWVNERNEDTDEEGRVVLEHETSNMTVLTSERWLERLQKVFRVKTVHECEPLLPGPYWEV
ncbi:chitin deacetylase [Choanephora cucurbitarum]|nr:chitin deacetylase [Choanephora cucurbitarum]